MASLERIAAACAALSLATAAAAQQPANPPAVAPPQVDPELLFAALGLGADEQLLVRESDGCAYIWTRKPEEPIFSRWNQSGTVTCVNGLADGPLQEAGGSTVVGFRMGRVIRYRYAHVTKTGRKWTLIWDPFPKSVAIEQGLGTWHDDDPLGDGVLPNSSLLYRRDGVTNSFVKEELNCARVAAAFPDRDAALQQNPQGLPHIKSALKFCKTQPTHAEPVLSVVSVTRPGPAVAGQAPKSVTQWLPCAFHERGGPAPDQTYCGQLWDTAIAPFLPQVRDMVARAKAADETAIAWADALRPALGARLAQQRETQRLQQAKALQDRQASWLASASRPVPKVARPFSPPAQSASVGVILTGPPGNFPGSFQIDVDILGQGVEGRFERIEKIQVSDADFNAAFAKLKAAGASTVYVVYTSRSQTYDGVSAVRTAPQTVVTETKVTNNPEYARLQQELQRARAEEAAAKVEYDAMSRRASSGAYGSGAQGLISGAFEIAGKSGRYSTAQNRRIDLEAALSRTGAQNRYETRVTVPLGDIDLWTRTEARLGLMACNLVIGLCAERERAVSAHASVTSPLVIVRGDPNANALRQRAGAAELVLMQADDEKLKFGVSPADIGTFLDGSDQRIPVAALGSYLAYADEQFREQVADSLDSRQEGDDAVMAKLAQIGEQLGNIAHEDPTGWLEKAAEAAAETKRMNSLQRLE